MHAFAQVNEEVGIANQQNEKNILIDDYAHHPQELKALIKGVRSLFADKKLVLVFQPHLYSRTRTMLDSDRLLALGIIHLESVTRSSLPTEIIWIFTCVLL